MNRRGAAFLASAAGAQAALVVDPTNRSLAFTSLVPANRGTTVTLNGSLPHIINIDPAGRAACG